MRMYKPPHVGELITETLNELNLSIDILAEKLEMNVFETEQLVNGNLIITFRRSFCKHIRFSFTHFLRFSYFDLFPKSPLKRDGD